MEIRPEVKLTLTCGEGILQLATIILVILKLTGVIGWSWWWVLSPLILNVIIAVIILVIVVIAFIVYLRS